MVKCRATSVAKKRKFVENKLASLEATLVRNSDLLLTHGSDYLELRRHCSNFNGILFDCCICLIVVGVSCLALSCIDGVSVVWSIYCNTVALG